MSGTQKMKSCKACGQQIAKSARVCPHCGAKNNKPFYLRWWFWVLALMVMALFSSMNGSRNATPSAAEPSSPSAVTGESAPVSADAESKTADREEPITENAPANVEKTPSVPLEYRNALTKAQSYSKIMYMSKQGIYDQLTSPYGENFPAEAAQYAIDNLDADYKANALAKAKNYSDTMSMSKKGIYDQLISEYGEQFTEDEAQYAVDHLEADYNKNALEKAKSYSSMMSMSKQAIYDQLVSEYGEQFTDTEAQYAIDHLE